MFDTVRRNRQMIWQGWCRTGTLRDLFVTSTIAMVVVGRKGSRRHGGL